MSRRFTCAALTLAAASLGGCIWPKSSGSDTGGGDTTAWTSPMFEITAGQGVHFGPAVPTGSASVVNERDGAGQLQGDSFRLIGSVAGATCSLAFDRYGDGTGMLQGAYTVQATSDGTTGNAIVYPTGSQSVTTPNGTASCNGSDCNGASFVINSVAADHVYGYFLGGGAEGDIACTFWMPLSSYSP